MFEPLLFHLRAQGLNVGLQEWLAFQRALTLGLASTVEEFFYLGRSILVHSEAHYAAYGKAFEGALEGADLTPDLRAALAEYLQDPKAWQEGRPEGLHDFGSLEDLMKAFQDTLNRQNERHEGGNRWVGTGGTSPYGAGGRANQGFALGRAPGSQRGIRIPDSMHWGAYRSDTQLALRDFKLALKALRKMQPEGAEVLQVDKTIQKTANNAGEVELVFEKEKTNKVRLALFLDVGGSMDPHARLVTQLFTAAKESKTFKSLDVWHFHNCIYTKLYSDADQWNPVDTESVLLELRKTHRLIFVGDASMAPWELFSSYVPSAPCGLDWLKRFREKCEASIWLNPDPEHYWRHPTVQAIREVFPMLPMTLEGLRDGIKMLRSSSN